MAITVTSAVGTCPSTPVPVMLDAVGAAGGDAYNFDVSSPDVWVGGVGWTGTDWRGRVNVGPLSPWFSTSFPLTWDAGSSSWKGIGTATGGPGFACALTFEFQWWPRAYMGEQVVRAEFDELTPDMTAAWSWRDLPGELPGAGVKLTHLGGNLWTPDHVRGLTRKLGTAGVPAVLDAFVEWQP